MIIGQLVQNYEIIMYPLAFTTAVSAATQLKDAGLPKTANNKYTTMIWEPRLTESVTTLGSPCFVG